MQLRKVIEQIRYTSKEAKVYLAALAHGEAHVSDIAIKVNMPRSSVQSVLGSDLRGKRHRAPVTCTLQTLHLSIGISWNTCSSPSLANA